MKFKKYKNEKMKITQKNTQKNNLNFKIKKQNGRYK